MAEKAHRSCSIFALLHIVHLFLSFGLISSVVYLFTRLDQIELKQCRPSGEHVPKAIPGDVHLNKEENGFSLNSVHLDVVKRSLDENVTYVFATNLTSNDGRHLSSGNVNALNGSKANKTGNFEEKSEISQNSTSCNSCYSTVKFVEGNTDLVSCFEKLRVIVDRVNKTIAKEQTASCKLFQGEKGERGEKGCAGTSFAVPSFRPKPQTIAQIEGNTAVLKCTAVANPSAEIKWYRDNKAINKHPGMTSSRYSIVESDVTPPASARAHHCPGETPHPEIQSTLTIIQSNRSSDPGTYTCMARNMLGTKSYNINVLIQVAPKILVRPNTTEYGYRGYDTVLNFTVFADPPAKIQWIKVSTGKKILMVNQNDGSLILRKVQYKDAGLYQAVARNSWGEVRISTLLIVDDAVPAVITSPPKDGRISMTCYQNLVCSARGHPTTTVTWKLNGKILNSTAGNGSLELIIPAIRSGRYICEATNRFRNARRQLDIRVSPCVKVDKNCSLVRSNEYSGQIRIFEDISFSKKVYPNYYMCYWNLTSAPDTKIHLNFNADDFDDPSVNVKVSVYDGSSTYSPSLGTFGMAYRGYNAITSTSNQMFITFSKNNTRRWILTAKYQVLSQVNTAIQSNITVLQGKRLYLRCHTAGIPRPKVTWYRKSNGVMLGGYIEGIDPKGQYHFYEIRKEYEDTYVCLVESLSKSALGARTTTETTVTVNVRPKKASFAYHVITVNETSTLILPSSCTATGFPVPDIHWTKMGDHLPKDRSYFDSRLLNITNIKYSDRGVYVCTADYSVGFVKEIVHVKVHKVIKP